MTEMVLDTRALPNHLFRLIRTKQVKLRELENEIRLIPISEGAATCPLLGIAADCGFTVDDFLARKREEKVLEGE